MRRFSVSLLAAGLLVTAACSDTTAPLDPQGVQEDVGYAAAVINTAPVASLGALGPNINFTLADQGGAASVLELPMALLHDADALVKRESMRQQARVELSGSTAAVIPAPLLGQTMEYSVAQGRYVIGERAGAPANGVRFILYAVDPLTEDIVTPLTETGYVDLTRTVTNQVATARVEAYSNNNSLGKVLDYSVTLGGLLVGPTAIVTGFARNATDSLTFSLTSAFSLQNASIDIDWRTALPSRGLTSRMEQTITGGEVGTIEIDGRLSSRNGSVGISGTLSMETGGTLTVTTNGNTFATITISPESEPVILNAQGNPPTEAQLAMLRQILDWFEDAFDMYEDLLDPVETLLDIAF
ncbi:MAG: hypothetical protein IT357_07970 [Gemmatimonadaceae bacterium]|nr:hypothetical protein [Gemmatimonadaceae bacterium]